MTLQGEFSVRPATPEDLEVLVRFNCCLAEETEGKRLDRAVVRAGVARVLENCQLGRYFVAEGRPRMRATLEGPGLERPALQPPVLEADERAAVAPAVLGQLMITTEWSDWRSGLFWWIRSVDVLHSERRRGVLRALFQHVAALARQEGGVCGLRLYGERHNLQAQAASERLGMHPSGYLVYELPCSP